MDITTITRGIILHQVNCQGAMGSGVALAIRNKWPKVYEKYREHYKKAKLGMIQIIHIDYNLLIVNLFAQDRYGRDKCHTDYDALSDCLKKVSNWHLNNHTDLHIYIPYKMGCGNAGGNWDIVYSIIKENLTSFKITKDIGPIRHPFNKTTSKP